MDEPQFETTADAHFADETIAIDGKEFVNCTFERCTITYSGGAIFFLPGSKFQDCTFEFQGPALRTLEALRVLHGFGMQEFVGRITDWITGPRADASPPDEA